MLVAEEFWSYLLQNTPFEFSFVSKISKELSLPCLLGILDFMVYISFPKSTTVLECYNSKSISYWNSNSKDMN